MNLKFKVVANTLVQILGKFIGSGASLLVTLLVARSFGVEGYGEFTKIMAYVAPFYLIADFGFNAVVLKKISGEEKKTGSLFSSLLGLRFTASLFLIFAALSILSLLPYDPILKQGFSSLAKTGIIIASLTILTQAVFNTANVLFQKNMRYDFSVLASSSGSILTLILVFAFTLLGAPLAAVISGYVFGGILMAGTSLTFVRRFVTPLRLNFDLSLWRKLIWQTLPLGLTLVFNLVYFRADIFLLSFLTPNADVGIYGLAYSFFSVPLAPVTFFMNAIYPVMLWRLKDGEENLKNLIKKLSLYLFLVSLGVAGALFFLAPYLKIIRADFAPSTLALQILSLSLPLFFLSALFMWVLIALGKQQLLMLFYGLSMILNILLNLVFIPHYGYLASAVITGVTELFVLALTGLSAVSFLTKAKTPSEAPLSD